MAPHPPLMRKQRQMSEYLAVRSPALIGADLLPQPGPA